MTLLSNRLVTRGFGPRSTPAGESGPVTMGLGKASFGPAPVRLFLHNRLVTRGFSTIPFPVLPGAAGPVLLGMGSLEHPSSEVARPLHLRLVGPSHVADRPQDRPEEVIIFAQLVEVNGAPLARPIVGRIMATISRNEGRAAARWWSSRVMDAWERIRVSVRWHRE